MLVDQIEEQGFAVIPNVLTNTEMISVIAGVERHGPDVASRGGLRNALEHVPEARAVAAGANVRGLVDEVLGPDAILVRSILFDKTPSANWKVAWHQDLSIAVRGRVEMSGFGPWSEKAGVVHVQPPVEVLEVMITVRIHLDDCGVENGPLKVIAGSHRAGRLTPAEIEEWRARHPVTTVTAGRGDALVMRPLLLHASSAATKPGHRRVLHLEFAGTDLPSGLEWQSR